MLGGGSDSESISPMAAMGHNLGLLMMANPILPYIKPDSTSGGTKMNPTSTLNIRATIGFSAAYVIGIQMSKLAVDMNKINFEKSQRDTKNQVRSLYYSVLIAQNTIDLLTSTTDNLKKLYVHVDNAVKAGIKEQTDADQIAIQVYSMQNTLNTNKRNIEILTNALVLLLGLPVDAKIEITDNLETLDISFSTMNLLSENFNIEKNPDFQLLKHNELLAKKQYQMSAWAYAPSVGAFYQYSYKILKPTLDFMSPTHVAGVTLNVPLFSSGDRFAKIRQTKFALQAAQNKTEMVRDQLLVQEKQLRNNITAAYENYHIQKKSIEISQRVFEKVTQKYQLGYSSSLDLTNASMNLISAQSAFVGATYELINAQLELEKLLDK